MIHWSVEPELIHLGPLAIRWYGLLFATAFYLGMNIEGRYLRVDEDRGRLVDPLLIYMAVGTIVGARLGHVLFYEPDRYLADPLSILRIWEGGLASHGAAVGIFTSIYLFSRKYKVGYLWTLDRLAAPVALAGFLIRMGNLFNSEIIGKPAAVPWAFVFTRVDLVPRHPAQLYEALWYLASFFILRKLFWTERLRRANGFLFGIFLILIFGARFVIEFFKENQVSFESQLPINMGQILSLPLIAAGAYLAFRATAKSR